MPPLSDEEKTARAEARRAERERIRAEKAREAGGYRLEVKKQAPFCARSGIALDKYAAMDLDRDCHCPACRSLDA